MDSIYVVVIAIVVLFGGSQLPKLARNAGEAMKEFRKAHVEATSPLAPAATSAHSQEPVAVQPAALPPVQQVQPGAPGDDRVTLSRSELDALLADREARARSAQGGPEA